MEIEIVEAIKIARQNLLAKAEWDLKGGWQCNENGKFIDTFA